MTIEVEMGAPPSVAAKTALAAAWVIVGKLLARGIDLISLLLLARLLTPADFGLIAMAMTVLFVVEAILELPLAQALIRMRPPSEPMFATAFTLGVIRAAAIATLMAAASVPMSRFFEEPRLVPLICVLSLAPILRGLGSPKMILFMQSLDFRREAAMEIMGKTSNLLVAVPFAYVTQSHWALAVGTITAPFVMTATSYVLAPMRPRLTLAEWHHFKDMVGWNSLSQLISATNWQIDRILLGRLADIVSFGRYSMANTLTDLPQQALVQPVARPLMAAFATSAQDGTIGPAYQQATATLVLFAAPVFLCMSLLAAPIIHVAVGEKWLPAAPILQWIALAQLLTLPTASIYAAAMALNRARIVTLRLGLEFMVNFPAVVILAFAYGIPGAIAARYVSMGASLVFCMIIVSRLIGLSIKDQLLALWRPYTGLLAASLPLFALRDLLPVDAGVLTSLLVVVAGVSAAGCVYVVAVFSLWKLAGSPPGVERSILEKVLHLRARRFKRA